VPWEFADDPLGSRPARARGLKHTKSFSKNKLNI